jgi:hypothetical protein
MIGVLALLLMPACATVAGLVVGVAHRHEALDDGALLRNFLIILVIGMTAAWGIGRTDAVQMRLYPQLRMQTDLNAHPVYVAFNERPTMPRRCSRRLCQAYRPARRCRRRSCKPVPC